jgi:hypothetical protein
MRISGIEGISALPSSPIAALLRNIRADAPKHSHTLSKIPQQSSNVENPRLLYRIRLPASTSSDMVNLTRAKDALRGLSDV